MKRIYTLIPAIMLTFGVTANADFSVSQSDRLVTVEGALSEKTEGQKITVKVKNSDGEYVYLGQTTCDSNGEYSVVFSPKEDEDDELTVIVTPANTALLEETENFEYVSATKEEEEDRPSYSGGGGGGGGGGGSRPVISMPVQIQPVITPEKVEEPLPAWVENFKTHWAYNDIAALVKKGVIAKSAEIVPDKNITRMEFVSMICKAMNMKAEKYSGIFADVEASEDALYLQAAVDAGVISVDTHFRPQDEISRQEMCKVICLAKKVPQAEKQNSFTDEASFGQWAVPHIYNAASAGLIKGMPDGSFAPHGFVTHAQAATVANRMINK